MKKKEGEKFLKIHKSSQNPKVYVSNKLLQNKLFNINSKDQISLPCVVQFRIGNRHLSKVPVISASAGFRNFLVVSVGIERLLNII